MSSQWADKPYPLISTDPFSKDVRLYIPPSSFHINTNVTLTVLPRGILCRNANDPRPQRHPPRLNAIYLQAPHLPRSDIHDFLTYCQCWCDSMHHHHDAEESDFFPSIALIADDRGIMEGNVEQHRAFTPGFASFQDYVRTCVPQDYDDGRQLRRLVEAFAEPLARHLHDEIATLRALDIYDSGRIRHAYRRFEKTLMATDNYRIAPLVFGTADRSFEGGMHDFPSVPFFVPYIIHYWFAQRYRGAWRFNPCTIWRDRRELAFDSGGTVP